MMCFILQTYLKDLQCDAPHLLSNYYDNVSAYHLHLLIMSYEWWWFCGFMNININASLTYISIVVQGLFMLWGVCVCVYTVEPVHIWICIVCVFVSTCSVIVGSFIAWLCSRSVRLFSAHWIIESIIWMTLLKVCEFIYVFVFIWRASVSVYNPSGILCRCITKIT